MSRAGFRPTDIVIDARLTLEWLGERHIVAGTAMVDRSRPELVPWMPWAEASDEAAYRAHLARIEADRASGAGGDAYAIVVDGAFAGSIDLHGELPDERSAQIGYWLGTPYWGHGWMTKSVVALVRHGFTTRAMRRLELIANAANVRSRAVAERAGFTLRELRPRVVAAGEDRYEAVYERHAIG